MDTFTILKFRTPAPVFRIPLGLFLCLGDFVLQTPKMRKTLYVLSDPEDPDLIQLYTFWPFVLLQNAVRLCRRHLNMIFHFSYNIEKWCSLHCSVCGGGAELMFQVFLQSRSFLLRNVCESVA